MCGRYSNSLGPEQLASQVGDPLGIEVGERVETVSYNIAPTDPVLAIVAPEGKPEARAMRWGLAPEWVKDLKRPHINARLEGLRSTGKFLGVPLSASHRALIVATEFIEWAKAEQGNRKAKPAPFGFSLNDGRPFCFAGLWTLNARVEEQLPASCTILTCDGSQNRLVSPIHDRMPVMLLEPPEWRAWLDPALTPVDALSICGPLPAERMQVRPLPNSFNDSRTKLPEELFAPSLFDGPDH